jgi:hypothetical protein
LQPYGWAGGSGKTQLPTRTSGGTRVGCSP